MKNIYILLVGMLISLPAFSQQMLTSPLKETAKRTVSIKKSPETRVTTVSKYMNYGELLYLVDSSTTNYYVNVLYPDSDVWVEYSDDFGRPGWHSVGQSFDPTAPFWQNYLDVELPITPYMPYTVDSIFIPYSYTRNQDTNPDELVVQFYKGTGVLLAPNGLGAGQSIATVLYDTINLIGKTQTDSIHYLLTYADTAANQKVLGLPVNISVAANGVFAFTATYFPGNTTNPGDTLVSLIDGTPITNLRNAFMNYEFGDETSFTESNYYNEELIVTNSVRYNYDTLGWAGVYVSGLAFTQTFHMDAYFKISYDSEALSAELRNPTVHLAVYPNPADDKIQFISNMNGDCEVSIKNMLGQNVISGTQKLQSGNTEQFNVSDLSSGIYILEVKNKGGKATAQFVKN